MKVSKLEFMGETYHLFYNSEAMLTLDEKFGKGAKIALAINPSTKEGKQALCDAVSIMAEQGELARRFLGYDKGNLPDAEKLNLFLTPKSAIALFDASVRAIQLGFGQEIKEDENKEVDLVLQELEKKT